MGADRYAEVIDLPSFTKAVKKLLTEEEQDALGWMLARDPEAGAVMPRTGGFRKLRWALEGAGKRGGARVVYYYMTARERVYLVYAYAKNERENLTREQENEFRKLARILDQEG